MWRLSSLVLCLLTATGSAFATNVSNAAKEGVKIPGDAYGQAAGVPVIIAFIVANWWWLGSIIVAVFGIAAVSALWYYINNGRTPWWFPVQQILDWVARRFGV